MSLRALGLSPWIIRSMPSTCWRSRLVALTARVFARAIFLLGSGHVVAVHGEEGGGGVGDGETVVGLDGLAQGELRSVDLGEEAVDDLRRSGRRRLRDSVVRGKVVSVCGGGVHVCPL